MPDSCLALTSSVSATMRRALWSPQAVTQAAQPLQRSDEDGEDAAGAGRLALGRGEDGIDFLIGHRDFGDDVEELIFCAGRESVDGAGDLAHDGLERGAGFDLGQHARAGLLLDFRERAEELDAIAGVGDVVLDGRRKQGGEVLRRVGQGRVRADGDALHALGAVFGDEQRGFAARHVFAGGVAGSRGDDAHGRERGGRLVIAEGGAEFGVEVGDAGDGRARALTGRHGRGTATGAAGTAGSGELKYRQEG